MNLQPSHDCKPSGLTHVGRLVVWSVLWGAAAGFMLACLFGLL
jgi:hypothetical protein